MKKNIIIISLLFILLLTGCSITNTNTNTTIKKKDAETLDEFIENHDSKHMGCGGDGCGNMNYVLKNFKCSVLDDKEIKYMTYHNIVTSDSSIYEIVLDSEKQFSNNEQCKPLDLGIKVDNVYTDSRNNSLVIQSGDKIYQYNYVSDTKAELSEMKKSRWENIDVFIDGYSLIGYKDQFPLGLKDGEIYLLKLNDDRDKIVSKEVYLSKDKYGSIKDAKYNDYVLRYKKDYLTIDEQIVKLITDKGIYVLKENETEECKKYEGVQCEMNFVMSDIYEKYKDDIKYLGLDYTILKNNNIISTNIFYASLDD